MTGGQPIKAIAVESFRLFPPLYVPADLLEYLTSPNFWTPHSATFWNKKTKQPLWCKEECSQGHRQSCLSVMDDILTRISNVLKLYSFQGHAMTAGITVRP